MLLPSGSNTLVRPSRQRRPVSTRNRLAGRVVLTRASAADSEPDRRATATNPKPQRDACRPGGQQEASGVGIPLASRRGGTGSNPKRRNYLGIAPSDRRARPPRSRNADHHRRRPATDDEAGLSPVGKAATLWWVVDDLLEVRRWNRNAVEHDPVSALGSRPDRQDDPVTVNCRRRAESCHATDHQSRGE